MATFSRGRLAGVLVLMWLGAWFLALELSLAVRAFAYDRDTWPLEILGVAAFLRLVGLLSWTPGLVIPAAIVGGLGGLLYYQNTTGDWASWAYAWTLLPGFVGVGLLLFGLWRGHPRGPWSAAGWLLAVSARAVCGLRLVFGRPPRPEPVVAGCPHPAGDRVPGAVVGPPPPGVAPSARPCYATGRPSRRISALVRLLWPLSEVS